MPELKKVNDAGFEKVKVVAEAAEQDGQYAFILTGSLIDDVKKYETEKGAAFEVYNTDATPLKTIMRANPGLLILKKGVIVGKYHYNELGSYADLKKSVLK